MTLSSFSLLVLCAKFVRRREHRKLEMLDSPYLSTVAANWPIVLVTTFHTARRKFTSAYHTFTSSQVGYKDQIILIQFNSNGWNVHIAEFRL